MRGSIPLPQSSLRLVGDCGEETLRLKQDYLLYQQGAQTYIPNPVPLVFAGYGIVAPEFDYNDYQRIDVSGKIVVFLSGEPPSRESNYFNGDAVSPYAYPAVKQRIALSRGARGSFMIPNPRFEGERSWDFWVDEFAFEHVTLAYAPSGHLSAMVRPEVAARFFRGAETSLAEVLSLEERGELFSFPLPTRASFRGIFRNREFVSSNVAGLLEGSDPNLRDSYLLLSAHYDHLGRGPAVMGDSIYNGLADNASGVSALLEIARVWAREKAPRRSVLFLFTTGEEKGLLGAYYYCEHPIVPLHKTVANVNVDGVAIFDTFRDLVGIGAGYSTLADELHSVAESLGLSPSNLPVEAVRTEAFARSDQAAFAEAGIPALLLIEGLDYEHFSREEALRHFLEWERSVYHSPFDDLSQPINLDAAAQHCAVIWAFSQWLTDHADPPRWHDGVPYGQARLQSIAERR
jgi:hypothetical protein